MLHKKDMFLKQAILRQKLFLSLNIIAFRSQSD